jgi:hypothetical protein
MQLTFAQCSGCQKVGSAVKPGWDTNSQTSSPFEKTLVSLLLQPALSSIPKNNHGHCLAGAYRRASEEPQYLGARTEKTAGGAGLQLTADGDAWQLRRKDHPSPLSGNRNEGLWTTS